MDDIVEEWNAYYLQILIPNIVWNILCLVLGFVGNTFVLIVYMYGMKQNREDRYFIPIIALLDLLSTVFSSVHYVIDYVHYVTYPSSELCTAVNFLSFYSSALSAHCLLVIGIQRYLKISKPHGFQMTLRWRRIAVVVMLSIAASYSIPILFAAGNKKVDWIFKGQNVTGITCSINAKDRPGFSSIFYPATLVIIITNIIATMSVYIAIGCVIYKVTYRKKQTHYGVNIPEITPVKENSTDDSISNNLNGGIPCRRHSGASSISDIDIENRSEINDKKKTCNSNIPGVNTFTGSDVSIGPDDILYDTRSKASSENKNRVDNTKSIIQNNSKKAPLTSEHTAVIPEQKTKKADRATKSKVNFNFMLLTIVAFYLLSYIPTGIMFIVSSTDKLYWFNQSDVQLGFLICLQRFYVVNHIVNPFIYGYFDFHFRKSIKSLFNCKES